MQGPISNDSVRTPWGRVDELRAKRLRPGPGTGRELVMRDQTQRIFAAMVTSTAVKGYAATTVGDLITLAGVSRATFYEHFDDKADCFKATLEALLDEGLSLIRRDLEGPGTPADRGRGALESLFRLVAEQAPAARMVLVESYAAGAAGTAPVNNAFEEACELAHEALRALPDRGRLPPVLSRAVIGGLHHYLYVHLLRDEAERLPALSGELWDWASGFKPPPSLPKPRRRRAVFCRPDTARDRHEHILRGFADAVAARGFPKVTIPQVAAEAAISNATFYHHFDNKEDAVMAALDLSGAQLGAAALPAARREPDWPSALRRALEGVCGFLASEPAFARLRAVEVYSAGPEAVAERDRAWDEILEALVPAEVRGGSAQARISLEASSGASYGLVYEKVRRGQVERLGELPPLLSYIMLAPLLGHEQAETVARGGRLRGRAL